MAEMNTRANDASVEDFLNRIRNARRREDAFAVLALMQSVTRKKPKMWGPSIVGCDQYHDKYASGREGDTCMIGSSPRSQAIALHGLRLAAARTKKLEGTTGGSCLYIKKLEDVDVQALRQLIAASYKRKKDVCSAAWNSGRAGAPRAPR